MDIGFNELHKFDMQQEYVNRTKIMYPDHIFRSGQNSMLYENGMLQYSSGECEYFIDSNVWGMNSQFYTKVDDLEYIEKCMNEIENGTFNAFDSDLDFNEHTVATIKRIKESGLIYGETFDIIRGHVINRQTNRIANGIFIIKKIGKEDTLNIING
jgi:hypothetical protein